MGRGIVSAQRQGFIQTEAPIDPGNGKGPMLDEFGNVVGVVVSRIDERGRDNAGIGFAIPVNEVRRTLEGR